jgi:hypothetical protein
MTADPACCTPQTALDQAMKRPPFVKPTSGIRSGQGQSLRTRWRIVRCFSTRASGSTVSWATSPDAHTVIMRPAHQQQAHTLQLIVAMSERRRSHERRRDDADVRGEHDYSPPAGETPQPTTDEILQQRQPGRYVAGADGTQHVAQPEQPSSSTRSASRKGRQMPLRAKS